jgi:hypothetical protein
MTGAALASSDAQAQIASMASKSTRSDSPKRSKSGTAVLGRSAATGGYVLVPATKGSSTAIRKTRTAVKRLHSKKK